MKHEASSSKKDHQKVLGKCKYFHCTIMHLSFVTLAPMGPGVAVILTFLFAKPGYIPSITRKVLW